MNRKLTGNWYLKKKLFGHVVMVQTKQESLCQFDLSKDPRLTKWEKAKPTDLMELGIKCG